MVSRARPVVCLVTPGTRDANNGNWRTAQRWSEMLRGRYRVIVQTQEGAADADALIALHARRSAAAIEAFRARGRPIAVVLTGTDLYRDLETGPEVARSLDAADRIVVLQDHALRLLSPDWRRKARVIFQSARTLRHRGNAVGRLDCVMVGHLRPEKDPETLFRAIARLPADKHIRVRHVGAPLDAALARAARALERRDARYRYTGPLPHGLARAAIGAADLLIHPSIMEGGANVIVEAVTAGTPVVASRISGNLGMLGADYPGYFEARDDAGLAERLIEACDRPAYLAALRRATAARKPLFRPEAEARAVRELVRHLLARGAR